MTLPKLTGLYGAAFIVLLFSVTACKKSSNGISSAKLGTITFQMDGKTQTFPAVADSDYGGGTGVGIDVFGTGKLAGSNDSVAFYVSFYNGANPYVYQYSGNFSDTTSNTNELYSVEYMDFTAGTYYFNNTAYSASVADITVNNGSVLSGTFKGNIWIETGYSAPGPDSIAINNGSFSVNF